jgi:hypothetical protein
LAVSAPTLAVSASPLAISASSFATNGSYGLSRQLRPDGGHRIVPISTLSLLNEGLTAKSHILPAYQPHIGLEAQSAAAAIYRHTAICNATPQPLTPTCPTCFLLRLLGHQSLPRFYLCCCCSRRFLQG